MDNQTTQPSESQQQSTPGLPNPAASAPLTQPLSLQQKQSAKNKFIVGFVVVISLLVGGSLFTIFSKNNAMTKTVINTPSISISPTPSIIPISTVSDTSDAQINQDTQAIDKNMGSLGIDVNATNQGLNDQSVDLSQ
jgi:hypothetical protein